MLSRGNRTRPLGRRLIAGAVAGISGAAAFAAVMELDRRLFRHDTDDLILLGRFVSPQRAPARVAGLGLHLVNGAVAGSIYGVAFHDMLPGPTWARGTVFANAENIGLYPLLFFEKYHPAIREGQIASYWNGTAFVQETLRHVVFGAVLGTLTERLIRSIR